MNQLEAFIEYFGAVCEGKRSAPAPFVLTKEDAEGRAAELQTQIASVGLDAFVRACAEEDGVVIDFVDTIPMTEQIMSEHPAEEEPQTEAPAFDPDAGKHAFEVFLDCINQDDGLVAYLIETLKNKDRTAFYKLSQITTHLDLDPDEFLYWLAHREDYAQEGEAACAALMDSCLTRLVGEGRLDVVVALLSGDQQTFEIFRCEAPELQQLPIATFDWFAENYLDRDYPIRFILKFNGVSFPETYGG